MTLIVMRVLENYFKKQKFYEVIVCILITKSLEECHCMKHTNDRIEQGVKCIEKNRQCTSIASNVQKLYTTDVMKLIM